VHLNRLLTGHTIEHTALEGRSLRLVESTYKGRVTERTLVVSGGTRAPRVDASSYRSAQHTAFDIDPIVVRPETGADRLGKKLGLNLEADVGDTSIDARYYFATDTKPEIVKDLFSDLALRGALVAALGKFDAVIIGPPGGTVAGAATTNPSRLTLHDAERVRALEDLAGALPEIRVRPLKHPILRASVQLAALLVLQGCILGGVFLTTSAGSLDGPLVFLPVLIGLAAALVLMWTVLLFAFRRRVNGFRPWLTMSLISLVALPFLAVGIANHLNTELDTTRPSRYDVTVLDYRPKINKKQSGFLRVLGLPASVIPLETGGAVEIDPRWMPRPPCKRLALHVAPGYFGNPWVSKTACLP
jgi:hypothetical protein